MLLESTGLLNETLRRALLKARITEEDVAAQLEVDPKTVRRWLEGRIPYLRHRWALASMLGLDETDLWPQARTARSRPDEVRAIYPSLDAVSQEVWLGFLSSAECQIDILEDTEMFLADDLALLAALRGRTQAGVGARICMRDPAWPGSEASAARIRDVLAQYGRLCDRKEVQIRLHRVMLSNTLYRADDELLIGQRAFAIPDRRTPVLHLRRTGEGDIAATYLENFNRIWTRTSPTT
jgi:transcriptional regulator with XRE-family HTH domain